MFDKEDIQKVWGRGGSRTGLGSSVLDNTRRSEQDLSRFYIVCVIALM